MSEFCWRWWTLTLDVSLKALLLAAVAGCTIWLWRVRRNNLKHALWLGVLAGMIGLPWLSAVLPAIPVPIVLRTSTESFSRETITRSDADPAVALAGPAAHEPSMAGVNADGARDFRFPHEAAGNLAGSQGREPPPNPRAGSIGDSELAGLTGSAESAAPLAPSSASRFFLNTWPVIAFTIWGLGALLFSARLLLALYVTRRMVQRSTPIYAETAWRNLPLRESPDISVPLTTGVLRPQILLPAEWNTWPARKLSSVLIHESSHLRRRDCLTAVAAEVMAALYWFHPLAWWLRRKLAVLAEDCCDDAAIGSTGDRAVYARHLLEIASVLCHERRRLHYVGLSMARPLNVERRILSILDTNRPLAQRLTLSVTLTLIAVILPLVAAAAALKPAAESATDNGSPAKSAAAQPTSVKTGASPKIKADPSEDRAQAAPSDTAEKAYQGKVVGADGRPLAGAAIWFAVSPYESPSKPGQSMLRQVAASDSKGNFSFRLKPIKNARQFPVEWTNYATLVAKAPGHGCDWLPLPVFEQDPVSSDERSALERQIDEFFGRGRFASRTLKLPQEAGPVRGHLVDLEGRPLKGVTVSVEHIQYADLAVLRDGFETASRETVDRSLGIHNMSRGSLNRRNWQALIPPVTTDDSGEFSLSGLGRDQIATVTLSGQCVEAELFFIVGTEMETKRLPHLSMYPNGAKDAFVGVNFTLAVGPAIPVSGAVTEFKSGKPIANAVVVVERLFSRESLNDSLVQLRMRTSHIRAVTDEQGRYHLTGVPPGDGHVLNVVPPKSEPWLIASQMISLDPGQPAATVDVQVLRGIWMEGQVTDADTGEPVEGYVDIWRYKRIPISPRHSDFKTAGRWSGSGSAKGAGIARSDCRGPACCWSGRLKKRFTRRVSGLKKSRAISLKSSTCPRRRPAGPCPIGTSFNSSIRKRVPSHSTAI